jgi:hypothetical protein
MSNENEVKEPKIVASFKITSEDGTVRTCTDADVRTWAKSNEYEGERRSDDKVVRSKLRRRNLGCTLN